MNYRRLALADLDCVIDSFCESFADNAYYGKIFPDKATRAEDMRRAFVEPIKWCIEQKEGEYCLGIFENGRLVASLLSFDYFNARRNRWKMFQGIFAGSTGGEAAIPFEDKIHKRISDFVKEDGEDPKVLFLLSIAVVPGLRRKGLASCLLDILLQRFGRSHLLFGDVSDKSSLCMYEKRNFKLEAINQDNWLVWHQCGESSSTVSFGEKVRVLVPETDSLYNNWPYHAVKADDANVKYLADVSKSDSEICDSFSSLATFKKNEESEGIISPAVAIDFQWDEFLQFQRHLNLCLCDERYAGDSVYYESNREVKEVQLYNDVLRGMLERRKTEWAIVPDIFVSCPMKYSSIETIEKAKIDVEGDEKAKFLLNLLEFRTQQEAGIPIDNQEINSLANFKGRLKRYYLGKIPVQLLSEADIGEDGGGGCEETRISIGAPAFVDLFISVDEKSNCAVLTWFSLSAPFLVSHLMDNVIRNGIYVVENAKCVNLYDYLNKRLGLLKRGSPKTFAVIPKKRDFLTPEQLASLLASEAIFPDGESFGRIIDEEIVGIAKSEMGMGQYDRATVLAHTNVALQFSEDYRFPIAGRLEECSIVLFFFELILIEEAAIHIANHEIETLFVNPSIKDPVFFLRAVDRINDDYYKTMAFWNIQLNYPTGRKSLEMLRDAFKIDRQLEYMQRNQRELERAFDTKSDIVDRMESRRMNMALAALSILTVFSALVDCNQYIKGLDNEFPHSILSVAQKFFSIMIVIVVAIVVQRVFGTSLRRMGKRHRGNRTQVN